MVPVRNDKHLGDQAESGSNIKFSFSCVHIVNRVVDLGNVYYAGIGDVENNKKNWTLYLRLRWFLSLYAFLRRFFIQSLLFLESQKLRTMGLFKNYIIYPVISLVFCSLIDSSPTRAIMWGLWILRILYWWRRLMLFGVQKSAHT